jgi:hypothetical protein
VALGGVLVANPRLLGGLGARRQHRLRPKLQRMRRRMHLHLSCLEEIRQRGQSPLRARPSGLRRGDPRHRGFHPVLAVSTSARRMPLMQSPTSQFNSRRC